MMLIVPNTEIQNRDESTNQDRSVICHFFISYLSSNPTQRRPLNHQKTRIMACSSATVGVTVSPVRGHGRAANEKVTEILFGGNRLDTKQSGWTGWTYLFTTIQISVLTTNLQKQEGIPVVVVFLSARKGEKRSYFSSYPLVI